MITLEIEDKKGNCGRFVNAQKSLDINQVGAKILWNYGHSVLGLPTDIFCLTDAHCNTLYNSPAMASLLNQTQFDLVIVDLIANECGLALAKTLGVPLVGFWGFSFHGGEVAYTPAFNTPALHPAFFSGLKRSMDFSSRFFNTLLHLFHKFYADFQAFYAEAYIKARYPGLPSSRKLVHDLELILVNTNSYVDYPKLLPPNVLQIGGFHLTPTVPPLQPKFEAFMSAAMEGVVLFSLGYTGYSAKDIPRPVVESILEAFASLPSYRFVMRFDEKYLPPFVPENVLVADWVPQTSILGHNKTVAFVTHCGISSVMESIYYGVPMLAVGIFADQVDNAAYVQDLGVAYRLDKSDLTDKLKILKGLNGVLEDSSYAARVRFLSAMWRDDNLQTKQVAIGAIEKLLKYGDFSHLRIEDYDLYFWQYFCLDVFAALALLLIFGPWLCYCCLKKACQFAQKWSKPAVQSTRRVKVE